MRKKGIFVVAFCLILFLSGCSSNPSSSSSEQGSDASEVSKAGFYQDLSKADRKDLSFSFKEHQDETQDNSSSKVYMISMTVKNKGNKTVKFDKAKFLIFSDEDSKVQSALSGSVSLKPHKSVKVNQIFEQVPEDILTGDARFVYLNSDYVLGKVSVLGVQKTEGDEDSSADEQSSNTKNTDTQSDHTASEQPAEETQSGQITSPQQAMDVIRNNAGISADTNMGVMSSGGRSLTETGSGAMAYWVRTKAHPGMWSGNADFTVFPDGTWSQGQPAEN